MKNEKSDLIIQELNINVHKNRYFNAVEALSSKNRTVRIELEDKVPIKTADGQLTEGTVITLGQLGKFDHKKNKNVFFVVKLPDEFSPNIVARNLVCYLDYCFQHNIKIK